MIALKIFAFVMWSLIVWCWSASIWYERGLEENVQNRTNR